MELFWSGKICFCFKSQMEGFKFKIDVLLSAIHEANGTINCHFRFVNQHLSRYLV